MLLGILGQDILMQQLYSELELVELDNGEIVLRQARHDSEHGGEHGSSSTTATDDATPMLRICFSHESLAYMRGMQLDVARHMVAAGIQRYNQLVVDSLQELEASKSEAERERTSDHESSRLLH